MRRLQPWRALIQHRGRGCLRGRLLLISGDWPRHDRFRGGVILTCRVTRAGGPAHHHRRRPLRVDRLAGRPGRHRTGMSWLATGADGAACPSWMRRWSRRCAQGMDDAIAARLPAGGVPNACPGGQMCSGYWCDGRAEGEGTAALCACALEINYVGGAFHFVE